MPRPGMGAPTLDVKCEMPSVPDVDGRKTMAREELKGPGGGLEIRSAHAPKTIQTGVWCKNQFFAQQNLTKQHLHSDGLSTLRLFPALRL